MATVGFDFKRRLPTNARSMYPPPVEYGIQRRSIYLTPPTEDDQAYLLDAFEDEEVWSMFGYAEPAKEMMTRRVAEGRVVQGIVRRVEDDRRIGFSLLFAPPDWMGLEKKLGHWEYGVVIPDKKDRNGFQAIQASDAMTHYCVDHLGLIDWWWRIREDNGPSRAIARRMGYRSFGIWEAGSNRFAFYRMTRAVWDRRMAKLERAEKASPSPGGAVFLTLPEAPYEPVREEASAESR